MRNTQESGQRLRSKKRPRRTTRSGRGSRTNSNTSRQIPARVIDAGYDIRAKPKRRPAFENLGKGVGDPVCPKVRNGRDGANEAWGRSARHRAAFQELAKSR